MRAAQRDLGKFTPPAAIPKPNPFRLTLEIQVMTALFGGGVRAGATDEDHPFRESSIRGHVRFWWRATAGGRCRDYRDLLEQESLIFGDQKHKSLVEFRVLSPSRGTEREGPAYRDEVIRQNHGAIAYAIFPAYEDRRHPGRVYEGGSFRLEVTDKLDTSQRDELYAAIAAWLQFGGIGARTRRGVGALYCKEFSGWWDVSKYLGDGTTRNWPTLRGADVVLGTSDQSWKGCWNDCLQVMRDLRQQRTGTGGRGRSTWPEPDEIRRLRGQFFQTPVKSHSPVNPSHDFPRAAFGMPIVFQFKRDQAGDQVDLDPLANELLPDDRDRMASPVILRPFAVSERHARPLLLVLNTEPAPQKLSLHQGATSDIVTRGRRDVIGELIMKAARGWHTTAGQLS